MYSEHGLDARIGPDCGQVCQSLIVVWNWMPGSAQARGMADLVPQIAGSDSFYHLARGPRREPPLLVVQHGSRNSSVTRTGCSSSGQKP